MEKEREWIGRSRERRFRVGQKEDKCSSSDSSRELNNSI